MLGTLNHASRDRLGAELRRPIGLWRDSRHAQFQHVELQCSWRAGHDGACHIDSAGRRGKHRQHGQKCTTPCTLTAPNGTGTFNVSFKLNGYHPQGVPVRMVIYPRSGHSPVESKILRHIMQDNLDWFDKYLNAGARR